MIPKIGNACGAIHKNLMLKNSDMTWHRVLFYVILLEDRVKGQEIVKSYGLQRSGNGGHRQTHEKEHKFFCYFNGSRDCFCGSA